MFRKLTVKLGISGITRQLVWNKYIGSSVGEASCQCCNVNIITPFNFECAHVVAKCKGGIDHIDNLRPSCSLCNSSMRTENFYAFKSKMHGMISCNHATITNTQMRIIDYYNDIYKNLTVNYYCKYLFEWDNVIQNCMKIKINNDKNGNNIIHAVCSCDFNFSYLVNRKQNDFGLTCQNSKQNLIDVIRDHMICVIHNKSFIEETMKMDSFDEWSRQNKYRFIN